MSKVRPWHSARPGELKYHNNSKCTEGNNIERYWWRSGTGGKRLCAHCQRLNAAGR